VPDTSQADETIPPELLARRPFVLAAAMLAMFMSAVEATIVATAMPTIVAELGGFHLFSWVFAIFLLAQAVTIPIYGRLADIYGRKRVFFVGAGIFLVGSALCGLAPNMVMLIVFRALQGLGAGAIMPISTTIVGDIYSPADRARIQGWLSSIWGVSAIAGPLLGAFLIEHASWALIFWINLPIGIAAIAMLAVFLDERLAPRRHQIDYLGSILLMLGSGALMLALVQAGSLGGTVVAALLVFSVLALAAFLLHESRAPEPMMPLRLWRQRIIAVGNLGGVAIGITMIGITAFLPTYVQGVMGRSPLVAGFALTFMSIGWPVASAIAGRLMVTTSYRFTAVLGGFCLVAGGAVLVALEPASGALWAGAGAVLIGLGMGFCNTTFIVAVQATVRWQERGLATSLALFSRMVGQALGAAIYGAVLNYGIRHDLGEIGDAVDRLMEPSLRQGLGAATTERLTAAIASALHNVYLLDCVVALAALAVTFLLPRGTSAAEAGPSAQRGAPPKK
jgi:EmrB/QacA subfamily drug resistance transporter